MECAVHHRCSLHALIHWHHAQLANLLCVRGCFSRHNGVASSRSDFLPQQKHRCPEAQVPHRAFHFLMLNATVSIRSNSVRSHKHCLQQQETKFILNLLVQVQTFMRTQQYLFDEDNRRNKNETLYNILYEELTTLGQLYINFYQFPWDVLVKHYNHSYLVRATRVR